MSDDIDKWALKEAVKRLNAEHKAQGGINGFWGEEDQGHSSVRAFARLIAKHEPEPVDPLKQMAREAAAQVAREQGYSPEYQGRMLAGECDDFAECVGAFAALRMAVEQGWKPQ